MNLEFFEKIKSSLGAGTAKIALTALHKNLESTVKHTVNWFQLVYEKEKKELYFLVLDPDGITRRCEFQDPNFISIIENMAKEKLNPGDSLDIVVLEYNGIPLSENLAYGIRQGFKVIAAYRNAQGEKIKIEEPIK